MSIRLTTAIICAICGFTVSGRAEAAVYRLIPSSADVTPGELVHVGVEVETEPGDNVVGNGYFSFAIDLAILGTAGPSGDDISNVTINELNFNDVANNFHGQASGAQYVDIAGVTTDVIPPTFGQNAGDVIPLFAFDLLIPAAAPLGSTVTLVPSEGFLESLVANGTFDNVVPQVFRGATFRVVPEPSSVLFLSALGAVACTQRRLVSPTSSRDSRRCV